MSQDNDPFTEFDLRQMLKTYVDPRTGDVNVAGVRAFLDKFGSAMKRVMHPDIYQKHGVQAPDFAPVSVALSTYNTDFQDNGKLAAYVKRAVEGIPEGGALTDEQEALINAAAGMLDEFEDLQEQNGDLERKVADQQQVIADLSANSGGNNSPFGAFGGGSSRRVRELEDENDRLSLELTDAYRRGDALDRQVEGLSQQVRELQLQQSTASVSPSIREGQLQRRNDALQEDLRTERDANETLKHENAAYLRQIEALTGSNPSNPIPQTPFMTGGYRPIAATAIATAFAVLTGVYIFDGDDKPAVSPVAVAPLEVPVTGNVGVGNPTFGRRKQATRHYNFTRPAESRENLVQRLFGADPVVSVSDIPKKITRRKKDGSNTTVTYLTYLFHWAIGDSAVLPTRQKLELELGKYHLAMGNADLDSYDPLYEFIRDPTDNELRSFYSFLNSIPKDEHKTIDRRIKGAARSARGLMKKEKDGTMKLGQKGRPKRLLHTYRNAAGDLEVTGSRRAVFTSWMEDSYNPLSKFFFRRGEKFTDHTTIIWDAYRTTNSRRNFVRKVRRTINPSQGRVRYGRP